MAETAGPAASVRRLWRSTSPFRPVLLLLVGLCIAVSIIQPAFRTSANVENLLTGVAELWIVALGMTFVVLAGAFDLSSGAIAATAELVAAKFLGLGMPGGVVIVVTILLGALVGMLVNGYLVSRGLNVFVVTLASMTAFTGIVELWSGAQDFFVSSPVVNEVVTTHYLGLPAVIWIMLVLLALAYYVQRYTYFGRDIYACGGNQVAARLSGIKVRRVIMIVFAISGACAALAGIVVVAQTGATTSQVDDTIALNAIAAVLLGGTALTGGRGTVIGTVFGALFIGVLQNAFAIMGVSAYWQELVTGVILIVAVVGGRVRLQRRNVVRVAGAPGGSEEASAGAGILAPSASGAPPVTRVAAQALEGVSGVRNRRPAQASRSEEDGSPR